jgi:flagellar biosynthesis protein FlhB
VSTVATIPPHELLLTVVDLSVPLLTAVAVTVALVGGVQTAGLFAPKRVAPDLSRMSPLSLFRGLASPQRAFAIVRSLLTSAVVAYLVVRRFELHAVDLARTAGRVDYALAAAGTIAFGIARDVALVLLALAVVDLVVTRRAWLTRLRMTKSEVKREHKESEGDPELKAARDRAHQEMLAAAALHAVRDATVVIVNPIRLANALRYQQDEDEAPVLVARGEGELARAIVDAARAYGIPIVQDVPVAQALSELSEGDAIPPSLYEAVAVILRDVLDQADRDNDRSDD